MSKFTKGDIVIITDCRAEGAVARVENWRGGRVAPYVVRILEPVGTMYKAGEISYFSGRDMELKYMQGKKKVWCCVENCTTTSFESKGTVLWRCFKHMDCGDAPDRIDYVSLEEKVDLILAHLGLEVTIKPAETMLTEKPKSDG